MATLVVSTDSDIDTLLVCSSYRLSTVGSTTPMLPTTEPSRLVAAACCARHQKSEARRRMRRVEAERRTAVIALEMTRRASRGGLVRCDGAL